MNQYFKKIKEISVHYSPILFTNDSKNFIFGNENDIQIFDSDDLNLKYVLKGPHRWFNDIRISICGKLLATAAYYDSIIIIWDLNTRSIIKSINEKYIFYCLDFSPNGQHLAAGDHNGNTFIWDLKNIEKVKEIKQNGCIYNLKYTKDNKFLVIGGSG